MLASGGIPIATPKEMPQIVTKRKHTSVEVIKREVSPLPGFMREYMQDLDSCERKKKDVSERTSRVRTTRPVFRRKNKIILKNASFSEKEETVQENRIFRLYKPQVISISPRSKYRLYSKVDFPSTAPLNKLSSVNMKKISPTVRYLKSDDASNKDVEALEYFKPALTYGEKLWRLNEISIFGLLK